MTYGKTMETIHDSLDEIAYKLDQFAQDFDPYEYMDQTSGADVNLDDIKSDLLNGNIAPYLEYLDIAISETDDEAIIDFATDLKSKLAQIRDSPEPEPETKVGKEKTSVLEMLKSKLEQDTPKKSSGKKIERTME